jgi:hypothetical protein
MPVLAFLIDNGRELSFFRFFMSKDHHWSSQTSFDTAMEVRSLAIADKLQRINQSQFCIGLMLVQDKPVSQANITGPYTLSACL